MKTKQLSLVAGVTFFAGLLAYFTFGHKDTNASLSIRDRMARIEQEQQRQYETLNQKIDRLAGLVEGSKTGASAKRVAEGLHTAAKGQEDMTPQQLEAWEKRAKQRLDEQFESQTTHSKWSLESTRTIESALTPESLKDAGALPPTARDIQCRSSMCRIQLEYTDSESAIVAGMMINAAIADRMPYTHVLSQPRTDGGIDYVIYATQREVSSTIR